MRRLYRKLRALMNRRRLERDLEDELRFHLAMKSGDQDAARRAFGNPTVYKEVLREMWTFASIESWWRDVRYGVRSLVSSPGFAVAAIAALGLGIGADTAMLTIVKGAFSWNMGLDHPDRIVSVMMADAATHRSDWASSYPDFRDYRSQVKSLEGIAAYQFEPANVSDSATHLPERMWCVHMSANGFRVSEEKPALGRDFTEADEARNATPVLMLSHHVWEERYGLDPEILGKVIRVDEVPRVVIGVMPPNRRFPEDTDLWAPLVASENRGERRLMMFGRIPANGNMALVRAELDTVSRALAAQYPATNTGLSAVARRIEEITGAYGIRPIFAVLFTAVGFVVLIACADVANMLLARGAARTREMSIRLALGAGRARIVRQLLIESVILSALGGAFGALVAVAGLAWFDHATLASKPPWLSLQLDKNAFLYLLGVSIFTGILFGLFPALRLAKTSILSALKDGGHGTAGGAGRVSTRLSGVLVVFQMVLCIVLLAGAGLMIRSANNLYSAPIGVNASNVLSARVNLSVAKYHEPADWIAFHRTTKARLEALPGVELEAVVSDPPLGGWETVDGELQSETGEQRLDAIVASSSYFSLFGVRAELGRLFTDDADEVVVNESFAAKYWPNESPVGKHVRLMKDHVPQQWLTVEGVIPDILQDRRNELAKHPLLYLPYTMQPRTQMFIMARTHVPPSALAQAARAEIQKMDPNLPLYEILSLEERIDRNRLATRLIGGLCTVFASIALVLAAIGLYAVIAHSVSIRSQEIGLRMAMGGTERDILRLIFAQGMRPLLIGILIGVPLAMAAMRALRTVLVGVGPGDPLTFMGVVVVLGAAGALGCAIPAVRAMRVDPAVALRAD